MYGQAAINTASLARRSSRLKSAICVILSLALTVPAAGQSVPQTVDSAGLAGAIALALSTGSARDSGWSGIIDTIGNRWNVFVRRALAERAPARLLRLGDSAAYYASHVSVKNVSVNGDTVVASLHWDLCYDVDSWAFGDEQWLFIRSASTWARVHRLREMVTTGHGMCRPFVRKGTR
jgi:hypothetical protein